MEIVISTKKDSPIYDVRGNKIGDFVIKLKIATIGFNADGATTSGYYFYEKDGQEVILDDIESEIIPIDLLSPILVTNLIDEVFKFTRIKLGLENGSNWGLKLEDFEI